MSTLPTIWWVRRGLRLEDNEALSAAVAAQAPVIPLFIHDEAVELLGTAPAWRLGAGLAAFQDTLAALGSRLILRRGPAAEVLDAVIRETGAQSVVWNRPYDMDQMDRDTALKSDLVARGIAARSFAGHLLFEPMVPKTGQGGHFKVYSPFWRAVKDMPVADCLRAPAQWPHPQTWPASDTLDDWRLGQGMRRGADVVAEHANVGAAAALDRLDRFVAGPIQSYKADRDFPGKEATSRLSEHLTYGEIAPRRAWHAGQMAMAKGAAGAEHFLKELCWREFAYHLWFHAPDLARANWRAEWDGFGWGRDAAKLTAWQRGLTGIDMVDAGMRELYVTGTMHNRLRMIVGSYLTKHLLQDWRAGLDWFADTLIDWDPAANAMGWQWIAGCGPDAAPYFRVFNPDTQGEKFDADRRYLDHWLRGAGADAFLRAVPVSWGLTAHSRPARPIVTLPQGRSVALAAYEAFKSGDMLGSGDFPR